MIHLSTGDRACSLLYNFIRQFPAKGNKRWLIPSNVCEVVPLTFYSAKAQVKYGDINPEDLFLNLQGHDFNSIHGIVVVAPYGRAVTKRIKVELNKLKSQYPELLIVMDLCLSYPELSEPELSVVDMILYSTGYSKPVDIEYGGFAYTKRSLEFENNLISNDEEFDKKTAKYIAKLKNSDYFGYEPDWLNTTLNKFDQKDYFAQIEQESIRLEEHKQLLISLYKKLLPDTINLKDEYQSWRFNILVPKKELLFESLKKAGLFASSHYSVVQPDVNSPVAEELSSCILNLFYDKYFSEEKTISICTLINQHLSLYQSEESFILFLNKFSSVRAKI